METGSRNPVAQVCDHIVQVTSGSVGSASRKTSGRSIRWLITETPDGDEDVVMAMAATTDSEADVAIRTTMNVWMAGTETETATVFISVSHASFDVGGRYDLSVIQLGEPGQHCVELAN